jgi:hypothetical protein
MWIKQAYAQNDIRDFFRITKPEGFEIEDLGLLISRLLSVALIIAGILVFIYLVWGGIEYITSGGDKAKLESAKARITAALIGLTIVATSWAVMLIVAYFFGLPLFGTGYTLPKGY